MKGMMPSPFDFEMVLKNNRSSVTDYFSGKNCFPTDKSFCEPISVLDSRIPSTTWNSSTPSSSRGGGSAASTDRNASPKWQHDSTTATSSVAGGIDSDLLPVPPSLADKCAMEDWETVLSESAASPRQQHSNFRWIMGDVEDPAAMGTLNNKFLQFGAPEFDFHGGLGVMDQAFTAENLGANFSPNFSNSSISETIDTAANHPIKFHHNLQNPMHPSSIATNFGAALHFPAEMKPSIVVNRNFLPFSYAHEPPAKKLNYGSGQVPKWPSGDARQQLNQQQQQLQFLPNHLHHRPITSGADELQQAIIDELHSVAELLQAGNPAPAQGILARLNQHLSPSGKPFHRAAFYCKEALQLLLRSPAAHSSPSSLLLKIGAYKSFSEISPLINFANFTCNQAILEAVEEFDRIHIVDFDIGYGGQWASLMQELAARNNGAPQLKITALVSPSTHDQLELILTRENLIQFANEINIGLEFQIIAVDSLSSGSWPVFSDEAVAVNIPVSFLSNLHLPATCVLGLVKQLSPRIVVSVERGCDRADLPVADHVIHAVGAYSSLLESLDAVNANANADGAQKMERLLIQPEMENVVMRRFRNREKSQHWGSLFLNCGFSPLTFSNFAEAQAELVVKKTSVAGFEVERRQSSLLLCWRGKELLSASVWRIQIFNPNKSGF